MLDEQQSQSNPLNPSRGPLTNAAAQLPSTGGDSIKPPVRNPMLVDTKPVGEATDPDTDGRRSYNPLYGSAFNVTQPRPKNPAVGNPLADPPGPPAAVAQTAAANPLVTPSSGQAGSTTKATSVNPLTLAINQPVSSPGGVIDDSASAQRDWESSGRYTPQKQLETMQRNRLLSDLTDPTITDPAVRENAAKALGVMNQTAKGSNPLDLALKQQQLEAGATANAQAGQLATLNQQYLAESDPAKKAALADQISVINGKGRGGAEQLTLPQHRSNAEIDAARERIAGLSPDEIRKKTSQYSATGRENPDFDPTLAKAVSLANRRKYGADDHFDQRQQAQHPAGSDGDAMTRFKADKAMAGHTTGKVTENGVEVFDAAGRLVGHYR